MEQPEDDQLERFDSESSGVLSILTISEDPISTSSSGDLYSSSGRGSSSSGGSSGEIPAILCTEAAAAPRLLPAEPAQSREELAEATETGAAPAAASRHKCVGRSNKGVAWGFTSIIGRRKEMEDAVAVVPGFMSRACDHVGGCSAPGSRTSGETSPVHFFGVYDGHGGSQVAKFCAAQMHEVIAEEWNREAMDGFEWQRRWEAAFATGFERVDSEVVTAAAAPEMLGSTAVVVILSGCQIITSNCGDSRAILCRGTQTVPLTVDQKPDRHDELMRIEGMGGKVINWNGARVFGVLAMSRAIGDRYLRPWIIPVPEITFTTRRDDDECLILASDGLWDVMTNDEVGEVARRLLRRCRRLMMVDEIPPAQAVADCLTEIAYGRNSSDNISIIVVDLKAKRKRQQRPQEG
ncbi:LOW QUALITY PROTEIN: probable protein phosphatase 2C 6 [Rhodamnia argentea]|uniref:protein-serine/threonine phosphatase n=1 Tax=Rhodamnia argentea TaxID=178133 RepID=A0A8B8Q3M1_9MYRT|nr:LOW QUALITY PROTEIN: probable protein phosphatase 2C 6 [Rhodamnia argentea]